MAGTQVRCSSVRGPSLTGVNINAERASSSVGFNPGCGLYFILSGGFHMSDS